MTTEDTDSLEAPWIRGAELRVLVDSEDCPDADAIPCIPVPGSEVYEIPNTEWVTFMDTVFLDKESVLYKFKYNDQEVYISKGLFQYLIHIPRRPQYKMNRFRKGR